MKTKHLLKELKPRRLNVYAFSLFVVLFLMATSTFAQVQVDKLRTIPTVVDDATTEFGQFADLLTDTAPGNTGTALIPINGDKIDFGTTGAWIEYQIVSPLGGDFVVEFEHGVKNVTGVEINIGVYKTVTETWPETGAGDTAKIIPKGNWNNSGPYYVPLFGLEAGTVYTMRINHLNSLGTNGYTGNMYSIKVLELTGSPDATLKDLKVNGESIEGFDPDIESYSIPLKAGQWITSLEAEVNHDMAIVEVPTEFPQDGNKGTFSLTVTSESGLTKTYSVTVAAPVEIYEGLAWSGDAWATSNVYTNKGAGVRSWGINNLNNNDYVDFLVFSYYDANYEVTINYTNGYGPPADLTVASYLNVSTLPLGEEDSWAVNDIYTKYLAPTLDDTDTARWDPADLWAQDVSFIVSLKAEEPTLLRIYSITNRGNAANIQGATFAEIIDVSVDATLSDLQVNGVTVPGFDPNITSYSIPVPAGTSSVDVTAPANNGNAQGVTGTGMVDVEGFKTTDTITVTSEYGNSISYLLNMFSPIEVAVTGTDSLSIALYDSLYYNSGARVSNTVINYFTDSLYVEYYIYSATDKDVHLIVNAACGNADTIMTQLNVSSYSLGSAWSLDNSYTLDVPNTGQDMWDADVATDLDFNVSLKAGEPVMLRVFAIAPGTSGAANIHSLKFVEGKSGTTAVKTVEKAEISVWGASGSLNIRSNDAYLGGTVQIYNLSGKLVSSDRITSSYNVYSLKQSGLYLVRVIGKNNAVHTTKCIVK